MEASVFECSVCNNMFDSDVHKPLCLHCGHTFCYACVKNIYSNCFSRMCPNCKTPINSNWSELPVNYLVIPSKESTPREVISTAELCTSHGHELEYFCVKCRTLACKKCAKTDHRAHRVELMEDFIDNDPCVADVRVPICEELAEKQERLRCAIVIHNEVFKMIGTARTWKLDVHEGKKVLSALHDSVASDLKVWEGRDALALSSAGRKRKLFRDLMTRYNDFQDSERQELEKIRNKLTELQNQAIRIQFMLDSQLRAQEEMAGPSSDPPRDFGVSRLLGPAAPPSDGSPSLFSRVNEDLPSKRRCV